MSRFALIVVFLFTSITIAQPAKDIVPPSDVVAKTSPAFFLPPADSPEWRFLSQSSIQDEINLTARQKATMKAIDSVDWEIAGVYSDLSLGFFSQKDFRRAVPKARQDFVAKTLTLEQQKRLQQILFQLKEREFGAHAAFVIATRDLGLRPEQLDDVDSIRGDRVDEIAKLVTSGERFDKVKSKVELANGETFAKMAEMLTRAQRDRLKGLKGQAFEGKVELGATATRSPSQYPSELFGLYDVELRYLANEAIRTELKTTDEQKRQIDEGLTEYERLVTFKKPVLDLHFHTETVLQKTLTAVQSLRFNQIMMQRRSRVSPEAACGHPAAVEALKLTPAQLFGFRGGKSPADVLSKTQLAAFEKLYGEPFELPIGVTDPYVRITKPWSPPPSNAFARRFLVNADRLSLSADQVKKLNDLATDEPKFFELIDRELNSADVACATGPGIRLTAAGAVAEKYLAAVKSQCWNVLDEKQQSIARQIIYGRLNDCVLLLFLALFLRKIPRVDDDQLLWIKRLVVRLLDIARA